jgi:hypothetical protein
MKGFFVSSKLFTGYGSIAAMSKAAACTLNLNLCTSIRNKVLKVFPAKGIKTPTQIIVKELETVCNKEDVHT